MNRPQVTRDQAIDLAEEIFDFKVDPSSAKELDSHDDQNFYLCGLKDGKEGEFLLKVYNPCFEDRKVIHAVHKIMFCLNDEGVICPLPLQSVTGNYLEIQNLPVTPGRGSRQEAKKHIAEKNDLFVCLFTFVPGKTIRAYQDHGHTFKNEFFYQVGQLVANVAIALKDLKCPVLEKRKFAWDLYYFDTLLQGRDCITLEEKEIVNAVETLFKKLVKPRLDVLPKQCIHGDVNDANVLLQTNPSTEELEVTGLIDFGDVNYSCRVFDIAIAAAYMMTVGEGNEIETATNTIAGFHDKCPLTQDESDVIFCCIKARLCQNGCFGVQLSNMYPDHAKYLSYGADKAFKILARLEDTTNEDFDKRWRHLCKK